MQLDLIQAKLEDDLRLALPTSVRRQVSGSVYYLEFLEVRAIGRYRDGSGLATAYCPASCGVADRNSFTPNCGNESCFTTLGAPLLTTGIAPVVNSDFVAVINDTATPYLPGPNSPFSRLNAYTNPAPGVYRVAFVNKNYPVASPSKRFYIVRQPVRYMCDPVNGVLTKYWGYPIVNAPPTPPALGTPNAQLSNLVSKCEIEVVPTLGTTRTQVSIRLTLSRTRSGALPDTAETLMQFTVKEP